MTRLGDLIKSGGIPSARPRKEVVRSHFYCDYCRMLTRIFDDDGEQIAPRCDECGEPFTCGECGWTINRAGICQRNNDNPTGYCPAGYDKRKEPTT